MRIHNISQMSVKTFLTPLVRRLISMTSVVVFATGAFAEDINFDIKGQATNGTLLELAETAGIQIAFAADRAGQSTSPAVSGSLSVEQALDEALGGTGLDYTFANDDFVVVMADNRLEVQPMPSQAANSANPTLLAQLQAAAGAGAGGESDESGVEVPLEEIIVTGTHIRGIQNTGSPMFMFDRDDIDKTGYATVHQFIQTLPQNHGSGQTESLARSATGQPTITTGNSINLRGLGAGSTLTLLNGYRLSPVGEGDLVDISMIPVTAVERIDVLTDGASAIYGSDAIAGVVNFVLRDDYEGAETRLRYGNVTDGNSEEMQFGQILGTSWDTGHIMGSYEYYRRRPLDANDRDYTVDALDPYYLLPDQERHSALIVGSQKASERVDVFWQGMYSQRDFDAFFNTTTAPIHTLGDVKQFGGTLGATVTLTEDWQGNLAFTRNETESLLNNFDIGGPAPVAIADTDRNSEVTLVDVKVDGPVFAATGGDVRLAIGGQYRDESYDIRRRTGDPFESVGARDVVVGFAEVFIPLVGEGNGRPGMERFEVTAAVRYEDYSDFGGTTDPKLGVLWSPVEGLNVRGSWGTSFKAPTFQQLGGDSRRAILFNLSDPVLGGSTTSLILIGSNPGLQPEEATTFTVGVDFNSEVTGLSMSLTYFDIDYTNRIDSAISGSVFSALSQEDTAGPFVVRNPSMEFLDEAVASAESFSNFTGGLTLADATAYVDDRTQNLSSVDMNGFDFNFGYGFDADVGRVDLTIGGQYLLNDERLTTPTSPINEPLNTPYNSIDLRLRGSASWNGDHWGSSLFINYVDSYEDINVTPTVGVDSWTTVDLTVRYDTGDQQGAGLNNTMFSLGVINLFDEDPPFLENLARGLNFDGANASALGRFVSLQITKRW